ncbi:cysteine hydrolase [Saccharolobus solfataricus]|uniref:Isochorismatase related protein (EntB-like1) n=3 Tax=Saccharolobus solfataricus TaxID=2287 RepID=Q97YW7_SACS2|nr:isochorismatase family cysteine hydrolase [Saccharolobus solfataricus]AAK41433.1 Isochorismatase related protein (entB-like1) [Saccharolobus solfataricus P2]AKA74371.1 cysteine hydrolase [Saccharolobus solfataricus]AKA77067.1 cysteine hydrolase [Saccharolobus solfataricus]AKA79759.1 cysteine hydrolase [Saccharolobus solfataricus]AZF68853.1 cysteine hydrolase [Saccharolobus solfataricus]
MSFFNPEEIKRLVNKNNSVLVVWDVQEGLVNSIFNKNEFIAKLKELIESARKYNVPIVYTMITPYPERFQPRIRRSFNPGDIYKEVYPKEGDVILRKNTPSIFVGTNFELMLRNAGIYSIVFTGIATDIGVETSARHAQALGFIPIVAKEAVSSADKEAHERSLLNMQRLMLVLTNKEITELWER